MIVTAAGDVLALDCKLNFDDNALFRHKDIAAMLDETEEDPAELRASRIGLSYVSLDGDIACLVNGAGLAMSTMDLIKYHGGEPANFLDVGGGANKDQVLEGFRILLSAPRVKAVLVNIFGGIMKCDTIATALLAAYNELDFRVPLVVRLEGTNVELGKKIIKESGRQDRHGRRAFRRRQESGGGGQGGGVKSVLESMKITRKSMETETMGRVTVKAKIENLKDLYLAQSQVISTDQARCVEVDDALVDTGATRLSMPKTFDRATGSRSGPHSKGHDTLGPGDGPGVWDGSPDHSRPRMHHGCQRSYPTSAPY